MYYAIATRQRTDTCYISTSVTEMINTTAQTTADGAN